MATLTTLPPTLPPLTTKPWSVAPAVAQSIEDLINTVVDNAKPSGSDAPPDDALLQIAIWVIDAAGAIGQDALSLTKSALVTDKAAQQRAECARTWALVAALVAVIVAIITVVIAIIAFIWAGPMVVAVIAADCAIISATISIIQAMPTAVTIQTIVIGAFDSLGTLSNNPPPPDQQARIKKDAVTKLRDAMTAVQSSSALHQQATNVDITQATATSDQTSRALQKLLGALRQWAASGRLAVLVTEFTQLAQVHSALAIQLKGSKG